MTIYEQIQNAIDYIESNLFSKLNYSTVAKAAKMSARSFYNYFWSITGYTYKEYVIKRRMSVSVKILLSSEEQIINIAFDAGYESPEAFTRAFKNEFGISPFYFRKSRQNLKCLEEIKIIKEMYMGVVIKDLPEMKVACFEGFTPDPENKAKQKMDRWLKENTVNSRNNKSYRIFGHNIDLNGNLSHNPDNEGYKFMVTIDGNVSFGKDTVNTEIIKPGRFVVTGIEGNFGNDPKGKWITDGWKKLHKMIKKKGFKVKNGSRWFEEELEPSKPGNLRLDLYLEIE
jgi:AraC-like DNA-binding protein